MPRKPTRADLEKISRSLRPFAAADLRTGFSTFKKSVNMDDLERAVRTGKWEAIQEVIPWRTLPNDMVPLERRLTIGADKGAKQGRLALPEAKDVHLEHNPSNPRIRAAITDRTTHLITTTKDGARAAAQREVLRAKKFGLSPGDVAANIRGSIGLNAPQAVALSNFRASLASKVRDNKAGEEGPFVRAKISPDKAEAMADAYESRLLDYRAMMIARTEVQFAAEIGQTDVWREAQDQGLLPDNAGRTWQIDGNPCPQLCIPMNGITVGLDEPWVLPDGREVDVPTMSHPHCVLPEALVSVGSRLLATSSRAYQGDVLTIRTALGHKLTCTANHPILTHRGLVEASVLRVGDHVIGCGGSDWVGLVDNNHQNIPARIHEIARAFRDSGAATPMQVPTSAHHFHGDGMDGDVAIIWADSLLRNKEHSILEQVQQLALMFRRRLFGAGLHALRMIDELLHGLLASADGGVGALDPMQSLLWGFFGCRYPMGFAHVAYVDSCLPQAQTNRATSDPVGQRESLFRLAASIAADNLIDGKRFAPLDVSASFAPPSRRGLGTGANSLSAAANGYSVGHEKVANSLRRDAETLSENVYGNALGVQPQAVVSVDSMRYTGHVYNLQTGLGLYIADGLMVGNCECVSILNFGE